MKRFLYLIHIVFTCYSTASAQQHDTLPGNWLISAKTHFGFVIAHRATIVHLQQKHVHGFEIELAKPLKGNADWQQSYSLPLYSITYQYLDLGAKSELGGGHAIIPRIIFPLSSKHWLRMALSAGVGIGYVEKTFDRYENYKNTAIGSHLNAVISCSYQARMNISPAILAGAGISFTHFSNGTIRPPNLGLNIPSVHAGFSFYLGKPLPRIIYKPGPFTKTGFNKLSFGLGIKGLETDFGTNFYGITAVNFSRIKIISAKSRLSLGVDGFYDPSLVSKLEKMEKKPVAASIAYRMGMNLGYELSAGNITLLVRNGLYVLDQYKEDGIYYIKSGVEYDFTKKLFAAFYLKTHFGKADYFEYAIGYKFL